MSMMEFRIVLSHNLETPGSSGVLQSTYSIVDYQFDPSSREWILVWWSAVASPASAVESDSLWCDVGKKYPTWNGVFGSVPLSVDMNGNYLDDYLVFGDSRCSHYGIAVLLDASYQRESNGSRRNYLIDDQIHHYINTKMRSEDQDTRRFMFDRIGSTESTDERELDESEKNLPSPLMIAGRLENTVPAQESHLRVPDLSTCQIHPRAQNTVIDITNDGAPDIIIDVTYEGGARRGLLVLAGYGSSVSSDLKMGTSENAHSITKFKSDDVNGMLAVLRPPFPLFGHSELLINLPLVTSNVEFTDLNADGRVDIMYLSCSQVLLSKKTLSGNDQHRLLLDAMCQDPMQGVSLMNQIDFPASRPAQGVVQASILSTLYHLFLGKDLAGSGASESSQPQSKSSSSFVESLIDISQEGTRPFSHGSSIATFSLVDLDFSGCPDILLPAVKNSDATLVVEIIRNDLCRTEERTNPWVPSGQIDRGERLADFIPNIDQPISIVHLSDNVVPSVIMNKMKGESLVSTPLNSLSENSFLLINVAVSGFSTLPPPGTSLILWLNPLLQSPFSKVRHFAVRDRSLSGFRPPNSTQVSVGLGRVGVYVDRLLCSTSLMKRSFMSGIVPNTNANILLSLRSPWRLLTTITANNRFIPIATTGVTLLLCLTILIRLVSRKSKRLKRTKRKKNGVV
eukprot:GHVH01001321.1.p1 GENE.GHVH01001321.1~~GHVH01001321.1.p1  ORF type:complete len:682 (+),score=100.69 GHVH01001321.1:1051-3096(+)